uniref:Uncharacterized protein n=1 Tax=Anguilla anguilla TaxID=7936 RepID=A0A0E9XXD7_ANGAN
MGTRRVPAAKLARHKRTEA